jgi:hypothetical protein
MIVVDQGVFFGGNELYKTVVLPRSNVIKEKIFVPNFFKIHSTSLAK